MRNFKYMLAILVVLLLGTLACEGTPDAADSEADPDGVLYQDDFSDPGSGWDVYADEISANEYYENGFRISVNQPGYYSWANPQQDFGDVRVEVDTQRSGGGEDNYYGVLCRYQPDGSFYALVISSDGFYGILKRTGSSDPVPIGTSEMLESSFINTGDEGNTIQAECQGNWLALTVNGHKLAEAEDADFISGDVGLIVATLSSDSTAIIFDNFSVLSP